MKEFGQFSRCVVLLSAVLWISGTPRLTAQVITGQITGRITDASGALVPEAQLSAVNNDTGLERTVASNAEGYYTVPLLPPGTYQLTIRKEGFRPVARSGITLQVDQVVRLDFSLEVGAVADTIEVGGTASVLETQSGSIGTVVSRQNLLNLPLNTRNAYRLALLVPGVAEDRSGYSDAFNGVNHVTVNGGRGWATDVFIDGVNNVTPGAFMRVYVAIMPNPDSLQEFKMETSAFSAEFGRTGAGVVNMIMKSGTNVFHGSAHDFFRNSAMDANNFFSNRAGLKLGSYKRNQFGGTLGGPVRKNKAFFFLSYESLRERAADTRTDTVPTAAERNGDFSNSFQIVGGNCVPVQIYDPVSTRANPSGTGFLRDPFPNNAIQANRLDKVGVKSASYYPLPNQAGVACSNANNYYTSMTNPYNTNQIDSKVDWSPTDKDRAFVGLSWFGNLRSRPNHFGTAGDPLGVQLSDESIPAMTGRVDFTHIVRPTLVLNFRGGAVRWARKNDPYPKGFSMTDLAFPSNLQPQMVAPYSFPNFVPSSYSQLGYVWGAVYQFGNSYSMAANATWIHGKQTVKFGGEHRINQSYEFTGFNTNGVFNFDRGFTQGPDPNVAAANRGNSIASMLLGTGTGSIAILPPDFTSSHYTGLFVQDNLKLTSKLGLELGLRWEMETPRQERYNQLSFFDFNGSSPLAQQVPSLPGLHGGLRFVHKDAYAQFNLDKNNFAPRIGLAYQAGPQTVIRTGYGLYYGMFVGGAVGGGAGLNGFQNTTQWVSSLDGLTPLNYLSNPFPTGLIRPTGNTLGLLTNVGQAITAQRDGTIERWSPVGYMQAWNFNVQHQFWRGTLIEVAYVGSKGTKLAEDTGWEVNQLDPQYLSMGSALQQLVPNPFYGVIQTGQLAAATITRAQLLRPYPQFLGMNDYWPAADLSVYHGFQLRAQKQFSDGMSFMVAYTAGKMIDDRGSYQNSYYRRAERTISRDDVPQRLVVSAIYELPIGRGKRFGGSWPAAMRYAIGNWQLNTIVTESRGYPLSITASNVAGLFNAVERANVVGDPNLPGGRSTADRISKWFNTSAFQQPAPFTLGNGPRNLPSTRNDGTHNVDFSVFKEFPWAEGRRVEFRSEFFNFFNHPRFADPGTTVGSGTFGVVSTQANGPRQVQLALKVIF